MNERDQGPGPEDIEARINALLEGELDATEAAELKAAAGDDRDLARAIVEAWQLQRAMDELGVEPAPASLRRKLRAIPRQQRPRRTWRQPLWLATAAALPALVLALVLARPDRPSDAEIALAQEQAELAFALVRVAHERAGRRLQGELDDTVRDVRDALPFAPPDDRQETTS